MTKLEEALAWADKIPNNCDEGSPSDKTRTLAAEVRRFQAILDNRTVEENAVDKIFERAQKAEAELAAAKQQIEELKRKWDTCEDILSETRGVRDLYIERWKAAEKERDSARDECAKWKTAWRKDHV